MDKRIRSLRYSLGLAVCLSIPFGPSAFAAGPDLVHPVFSAHPLEQAPGQYGMRAIKGKFDRKAIAAGARQLQLTLPNGKTVVLNNQDIRRRNASDLSWIGQIAEQADSDVTLTLKNGLIFGRIRDGRDVFEARSDLGGELIIEQIDISAMPACDTGSSQNVSLEEAAIPASDVQSAEGDAGTLIDILVVYSNDALADAGSAAQMEAIAQAAIDVTNASFQNSNMTARYRLVHTAHVNYNTQGSTSSDLYWVTDDATVAALRDQYGADMVHLLVDTPSSCGTAWVQRNPGPGFAGNAFAATDVDCAVGNLTFAHEHGHNLGFEHNSENSSVGSSPSSASYAWSFAHYQNGNFRTVMSYSNPCGSGCPRVQHFSNPDISYQGLVTGVVDQHDNARTGDLTASIVQNFRAEVIPSSNSVTFAAIGDYGDDSAAQAAVASLIDRWNVDFIIGAGDNRYGALSYDSAVGKHYCNYLADVAGGNNCPSGARSANAFFPAPGNHDYNDGGGIAEYENYFALPGAGVATSGTSSSERFYDVMVGPVHIFMIDSQDALGKAGPNNMAEQQAWLQSAMTASTAKWQIVLLHHAPYSSAQHGSYPALQWDYAAWGADAVIAGHDHVYERLTADSVPYFVNGLGGRSIYSFSSPLSNSQVRYNGDYGAMRIVADETDLIFEFVNTAGTVIDRYSAIENNPALPSSGIVNIRVAQSSDDAEELIEASPTGAYVSGHVSIDSTDLELADDVVWHGGTQIIGMRFQNVAVPQGSVITAAWLEFITDEIGADAASLMIRAQRSDEAGSFSDLTNDISSRPATAASVAWSPASWKTIGASNLSPDLSAVIQEVINRPGWSAHNNIALLITGNGTRVASSYDGNDASAPLLHIEYAQAVNNQAPVAGFTSSSAGLTVNFTDTSTDSDGSIMSWLWDFGDGNQSIVQNPSHDYAVSGNYTVTLTVTDEAGDSGSTSAGVTVSVPDTTPPGITAPADITTEANAELTAVILGSASVSDNQDPDPVVSNDAPAAFPVGSTVVTWTATDAAGNSAADTQMVIITDTRAPTITAPADIMLESSEPLVVDFGLPVVSDLADPNPAVSDNAPALFPIGTTSVIWTATDASGNTANATQTVTITQPMLQPPATPSNLTVDVVKMGKGKNKVIESITLNWVDNANNETGFEIEACQQRATGKGKNRIVTCDYSLIGTTNANVSSFSVPGVDNDHFRVRAVNGAGSSDWSNEAWFK